MQHQRPKAADFNVNRFLLECETDGTDQQKKAKDPENRLTFELNTFRDW